MRNSKEFSVPKEKEIPHRTGMALAKVALYITIVLFLIITYVITTFFPSKNESPAGIAASIGISFAIILIYAYVFGHCDSHVQLLYLQILQKKCKKKIQSCEMTDVEIDHAVDQEMNVLQRELISFFAPLILGFLEIRPNRVKGYEDLRRADTFFREKLLKKKSFTFRKIGFKLKRQLIDVALDAIKKEQMLTFDSEWIKKVDLKIERTEIYQRIVQETFTYKMQLHESLKEIDVHEQRLLEAMS